MIKHVRFAKDVSRNGESDSEYTVQSHREEADEFVYLTHDEDRCRNFNYPEPTTALQAKNTLNDDAPDGSSHVVQDWRRQRSTEKKSSHNELARLKKKREMIEDLHKNRNRYSCIKDAILENIYAFL
jgi:hypothetical protein